jgi:outer membrane protein assembly factor BamB
MKAIFIGLFLLFCQELTAQITQPFRFAFISDTHIGSPNGHAEADLRRTVSDINAMTDIAFVVITGDITELGTNEEIKQARAILNELKVPYYIIPGNHDTGWSESGGVSFGQVFGSDKFKFTYNGIVFLGCASGPYVRMSDGHVPRDAVNWLRAELSAINAKTPVVFLNHYPLDNGLDNWYEVIDLLKEKNTIAALCGHGHANKALNFEGIPAVMGRSNLRAKAPEGGYNLVDVTRDSMIFSERTPLNRTLPAWTSIRIEQHRYTASPLELRPSYAVNDSFPNMQAQWIYSSDANVIATPGVSKEAVFFGNSVGKVTALSVQTGKEIWSNKVSGAIFSSPAVEGNQVVLGSGDGYVYCFNTANGTIRWRYKANAAVLGSPLIDNQIVYIGASDGAFRALDLRTGKEKWRFDGLTGPVMSKPVLASGYLVFGAWDRHLYALDAATGELKWKWNNGSSVRNYSPAACIPVIHNNTVFITAPDRYLTAIDLISGNTLWRSNEASVRESIGLSENKQWVYGKTMNDFIVAFPAQRDSAGIGWKLNCGFGYEHTPSMLIEKNGTLAFGTKSGRVYAIDPVQQRVKWIYKIDNSMINTVNILDQDRIIAATMDGKLVLLAPKK